MAFHTTHHAHYMLLEPEFEYLETMDIDEIVNQILGDFSEVSHVILFMGTLDYMVDDDLEQLLFLNDELVVKGGYLLVVSASENMQERLEGKIAFAPTIEEAIDTIESEWLDTELFSEES